MNRCRVVPAIDLIDGRCVRLEQGDFERISIVGDEPVSVAKQFAELGFGRLHLVDLDGARFGAPRHLEILSAITSATQLEVDYSGGLRTTAALQAAFGAGASKVVIGSAAVAAQDLCQEWLRQFGPEKVIIGLDLFQGFVRVKGWAEGTDLTLPQVIDRYIDCGLSTVMSTDIARDGMLAGPSFDLYAGLVQRYPQLRIVASGGVRNAEDLLRLGRLGVCEAIVGKALYAGGFNMAEARDSIW
jgi:phosphoribosylformimino-5-aminoimidazole carboxamide ribotide isomerase